LLAMMSSFSLTEGARSRDWAQFWRYFKPG